MKAFLFAWNPKKWNWTTLEQNIEQVKIAGKITEMWSVASHKKIRIGDRAFLMRLGEEPKGIMASGFVSSPPFLSKHWSGEDKLIHRVMIDFEVIINPSSEPILGLNSLNSGNLGKVNWTPQSSGIEIASTVTDELEEMWFNFLSTQDFRHNPFTASIQDYETIFTEGTPNQAVVTKYERNPFARKTCINHYGVICAVCGFNFESVYGKLGKGFIHVHHLKQVASVGEEYNIDPVKDLRPVCPNCHAMIHRRKVPYSIEEIRERIKMFNT
jgi:5-methylcytosine-specific restriction protein A